MNDTELDAIKQRAERATKGPWKVDALGERRVFAPNGSVLAIVHSGERSDAELIAAARTDIPLLLAEVDRLRLENEHPVVDAHTFDGLMQENAKLRELIKTARADAWDEGWHSRWDNTSPQRHIANPYGSVAEGKTE